MDDRPCPSVLLLAESDYVPYHFVIGNCDAHIRVITVYSQARMNGLIIALEKVIKIKPANCSLCKSQLKDGFTVHIEDQVIVKTDIPAWKCINCDEAYFDFETSKKIDEVIDKVKNHDYLVKPIAAGEISLAEG